MSKETIRPSCYFPEVEIRGSSSLIGYEVAKTWVRMKWYGRWYAVPVAVEMPVGFAMDMCLHRAYQLLLYGKVDIKIHKQDANQTHEFTRLSRKFSGEKSQATP